MGETGRGAAFAVTAGPFNSGVLAGNIYQNVARDYTPLLGAMATRIQALVW